MFNMGGPIKQGVMHGIREPYAHGQRVMPSSDGRRPGYGGPALALPWLWGAAGRLLGGHAIKKVAQKGIGSAAQGEMAKKALAASAGKVASGAGGASNVAGAAASGWKNIGKNWFSGDPTVKGAKWGWKTLTSPTANTLAQKTVKSIFSPTGIGLTAGWYLWPDGSKRQTPPPTGIEKPGGYPGAGAVVEEKVKVLSDAERKAFANKQRTERVQKYLDMMGYDRSKKTAIADALIDASKIVSDRGTLDPKNITAELINPIIQATSKRLDKPDQIREAVGLMMAKGEIEKDLYKWKPGTHLKNAQDMADTLGIPLQEAYNRTTSQANSLGEDMQGLQILKKGAALTATDIEKQTRIWANKKGKEFKEVITKDMLKGKEDVDSITIVQGLLTGDPAKDDGFYQVGTDVIEVRNGVPKQEW